MAQESETQARGSEPQGRNIELKTLILAAVAAVTAAVVTSLFWERGTLISTALTPVIVTLTQEFLRRPAEKVTRTARRVAPTPARGVTALAAVGGRTAPDTHRFDERRLRERELGANGARLGDGAYGENGRGGMPVGGTAVAAPPPPFDDTRAYDPARSEGATGDGEGDTAPASAAGQPPERKVYGRRRFRWKLALVTGVAAFAIAAVVLTASELALGGSVGGDGRTSLFGGGGGAETTDGSGGDGSASDTGTDEDATDGSSEAQAVPEEESESYSAPEEEAAPEEPVEPAEPAPVEPAPAAPAPSE